MPCPTCNCTLHNIGNVETGPSLRRNFWCASCGTLYSDTTHDGKVVEGSQVTDVPTVSRIAFVRNDSADLAAMVLDIACRRKRMAAEAAAEAKRVS